jgi:hypothetical protein
MPNHHTMHRMAASTSRVAAGLALVAMVFVFAGCKNLTPPNSSAPSAITTAPAVHFSVTVERWGSWVPEPQPISETLDFTVAEGEAFGPDNQPYLSAGRPFKLVNASDGESVMVEFSVGLVIAGEGISDPSQTNPVAVTSAGTRLRTRTTDWGTDYTLKLLR